MVERERRATTRRPKRLRFRFDDDAGVQRAVAANISRQGAFLKASAVPDTGSDVVLWELLRGDRDLGVRVLAHVIWAIPIATLERPEPGFAVRFTEAWVEGANPAPLLDFISVLKLGSKVRLSEEERDGRPVQVHRFEAHAGDDQAIMEAAKIHLQEDLTRHERDRKDATPRRRPATGPIPRQRVATEPPEALDGVMPKVAPQTLSYWTRARPRKYSVRPREESRPFGAATGLRGSSGPAGPGSSSDGTAREPRSRPITRPVQTVTPSERPGLGAPPQLRRKEPPGHDRSPVDPPPTDDPFANEVAVTSAREVTASGRGSRRRGFGGLLGLFGLGSDDSTFAEEPSQFSPTFEEDEEDAEGALFSEEEAAVAGDASSAVTVIWKDNETEGRVERISVTMVTIVTSGPTPHYYERVEIAPAWPSRKSSSLLLHATVTRIKERPGSGERTIMARFAKIDERGREGVFQQYLDALGRSKQGPDRA